MREYKSCHICGRSGSTERHHIFGGAMRSKSERYKLVVDLCYECHRTGERAVHRCAEVMQEIHEYGQRKAMQENNWTIEDFRAEFYKNYLS